MKTITFKLSDEEARNLRREARNHRITLSEFVRRKLRSDPSTSTGPQVTEVVCGKTGARIFSGAGTLGSMTTESVRDLLADFP